MTNRLFKVVGAASLLAAAFSINSFADVITSVSFEAGVDTEAAISAGEILAPEFAVNDPNARYELTSFTDVNSNSETFKTARTYELVFEALDGNTFPKGDQIQVTGKGIPEITKKTVDKDNDTMLTVRVKAYPYYAWPAPEIKEEDLSKKITWSRPSGAKTEYIISYTDHRGDQQYYHGSTTNSTLSLTNYNKVLTNKKDDDDRVDKVCTGVALRLSGNAGSNPHTAPGDWAFAGSVSVDDVDGIVTYDNWGDLFQGVSGVVATNTGSSGSSSGSAGGPGSVKLNGWQNQNGVWYYYENSIPHKGWLADGGLWYYMNPMTGVMETGWINDGGKRYYLNPNAGGPQGSMVTGTQVIDGATCTFDASGALVSQQ